MQTPQLNIKPRIQLTCLLLLLLLVTGAVRAGTIETQVREQGSVVTIENALVSIAYDLSRGTYSIADRKRGKTVVVDAVSKVNDIASTADGSKRSYAAEPLSDRLGMGRSILVTSAAPNGAKLLLRVSLYDGCGFVAFATGLENASPAVVQIKEMGPIASASAFAGEDVQTGYATLDGSGGGGKTFVDLSGRSRNSRNNLLVTFGGRETKRSLAMGGLTYCEFEKYAEAERAKDAIRIRLYANDPVGKRVDPGTRYLPSDRFYLDVTTANPFEALEAYAERLRIAQEIVLNVCRFPIVDTWFAQVPHFGGGEDRSAYRARNDSQGAVEEMECIARSGFLKYSTVAVLLEPDLYDANNQQGWWDDAHWQRGPSNRARNAGSWESSHGQFVAPYDTARKWAGAIKSLGGVPMIYIQTGFRSQDYAEQFPEHMLYNQPNAPYLNAKGEQQYRDKEKKQPRKMGFDYTDPGFIRHLREVWENLRQAGVQGVKFDYPDLPFTGWPGGGMEDPYATTAMHYRNVFRMAHDGLGPDCYLHERALDRGSDVTLGLVTSQRTEGDTDQMSPAMVSRVGLRWYKNRVVVNYDMDGKNPFHVDPPNRDGERAVWTMAYTAAGTLMLSPSFAHMTAEQVHDLSRIYPFHNLRQSARPLDAFAGKYPQVYDFRVNSAWHQLTFYNTDARQPATIGVELGGDSAFGGVGLDPKRDYYVYDFWNDHFVGKVSAMSRFEQTLRSGEARMMSVHAVEPFPQFLSTNRHVMQGLVDLLGCSWDAERHQLTGVASVVGGETYKIVIATNGFQPTAATVDDSIGQSVAKSRFGPAAVAPAAKVRMLDEKAGLAEVSLDRADNGPVAFTVTFKAH